MRDRTKSTAQVQEIIDILLSLKGEDSYGHTMPTQHSRLRWVPATTGLHRPKTANRLARQCPAS